MTVEIRNSPESRALDFSLGRFLQFWRNSYHIFLFPHSFSTDNRRTLFRLRFPLGLKGEDRGGTVLVYLHIPSPLFRDYIEFLELA